MRRAAAILAIVLSATCLGSQAPDRKAQTAAIHAAKAVLISNFDSRLPRISLEYFLEYEGQAGTLSWQTISCPVTASPSAPTSSTICVLATVLFRDRRTVIVSLAVHQDTSVAGAVELRSVMFTDENGGVRKLRLIDLPAAIHSPWPKPQRQFDPKRPCLIPDSARDACYKISRSPRPGGYNANGPRRRGRIYG